jgi:hypothetical protein
MERCCLRHYVLNIKTSQGRLIEIKIGDGFCRLNKAFEPELKFLEEQKFLPIELLQQLLMCGVNLIPDDATLQYLRDTVAPKVQKVYYITI